MHDAFKLLGFAKVYTPLPDYVPLPREKHIRKWIYFGAQLNCFPMGYREIKKSRVVRSDAHIAG
jgi:hypothetical protein